jgi:phenylpyruvate tautomerase PptA (4-oxalocrotonate tautomerase family)
MTLVHVGLETGHDAKLGEQISQCIHRAISDALGAAPENRFQIITEQAARLASTAQPAAKERRACRAIVMIYLTERHSSRRIRALFGKTTELLRNELQIGPEEVVIGLIHVERENWWFGYRAVTEALPHQLP